MRTHRTSCLGLAGSVGKAFWETRERACKALLFVGVEVGLVRLVRSDRFIVGRRQVFYATCCLFESCCGIGAWCGVGPLG